MSQLKSITLRLPEEEYRAFDAICNEKGYSKTGKIREFIRRLIKDEIGSVKISEEEWERVKVGLKEIEKGKFTTEEQIEAIIENFATASSRSIQAGADGIHAGTPHDPQHGGLWGSGPEIPSQTAAELAGGRRVKTSLWQ